MGRFHFAKHRAQFAACHIAVRRILSGYLGADPASLRFTANRYGKPALEAPAASLQFNLSHCASAALFAVGDGTPLGVDIEEVRPIEAEVAEAHFSAAELNDLRRLEGDEWLGGFYRCWTRKEAILKAEGVGLNVELAAFDVTLAPGTPAALLAWRPSARLSTSWSLHDVSPAPGLVAALAIGRKPSELACFRLPGASAAGNDR